MQIYVIAEVSGQPSKIGRAANPKKRLGELQTGNPRGLELRWAETVANSIAVEYEVHKMLAPQRLAGEWFDIAALAAVEVITKAIVAVQFRGDPPPRRSRALKYLVSTDGPITLKAERRERGMVGFTDAVSRGLAKIGQIPEYKTDLPGYLRARRELAVYLVRLEGREINEVARFLRCDPTAINNWIVKEQHAEVATAKRRHKLAVATLLAETAATKAAARTTAAALRRVKALRTLEELEKRTGLWRDPEPVPFRKR